MNAVKVAVVLVIAVLGGWKLWQISQRLDAEPTVTLDMFHRIQAGASYEEVRRLIGEEGTVISELQLPVIAGMSPGAHTVTREWRNPDGSHLRVEFRNDAMVNKTQFRLE